MTVGPDTKHDDHRSANQPLIAWLECELARRAPKSAAPEEIARACLEQPDVLAALGISETAPPTEWRELLPHIRRAALALAADGRIEILRKGKSVDPATLKGVFRLRAKAEQSSADSEPQCAPQGAGNSSLVRPLSR